MGRHTTFPVGKDRFDPGICWTCADVYMSSHIDIHLNAACPVPATLYMKPRCSTEYLNVRLPSCSSLALIVMALFLQQNHPASMYSFVHIKLEMNKLISELYK